jgi:lysophospholipase L1-like esterase
VRKALLALTSVTITLLAAEGVIRFAAPRAIMVPWQDDLHGVTALPMALTGRLAFPGQFDTTITIHDRFRSRQPVARQPPAGVVRIAMLGDSSTFGFGSEDDETYPAALARALDARRGQTAGLPPVEVLNAGVIGSGTGDQALIYDYWVKQFQPSLVVLSVYWNDVDDDALSAVFDLDPRDGSVRPRPVDVIDRAAEPVRRTRAVTRRIPGFAWLSAHSELMMWVRQAPHALLVRRHLREVDGDASGADRPNALGPEELARFRGEIRWLRDRVKPGRLAVVFLPSAALFDAGRPEHARAVARAAQIRSALWAMTAEDGTPFFDAFPLMGQQPHLDRLYFTVDSHPNPEGNRALAGAVASFLIETGLVAVSGARGPSAP